MARWLWISLVVLVLDQVTKQLAEAYLVAGRPVPLSAFFNLTLAYNEGAAFSFLASGGGWQRWGLLGLAGVFTVVLIVFLLRTAPGFRLLAAALSLVIGGAVGNMVDRALWGHVIDFFDFHHLALASLPGFNSAGHWPIFNIADCAILIGAVLLITDSFFGSGRQVARPAKK